MTQAQLAALAGVSEGVVTQWEMGINIMAITKIQRWARVLGFDVVMVDAQNAQEAG